jgi:protein-S-isoprenylcysteine O-methyltransferase Ste14
LVSLASPTPLRRRSIELGLDIGEKLFVFALFARLAYGMFRAVGQGASWLNYLQLVNEGVVVVLILLRRPAREVSLNPVDWALAVGATAGPLLIRPEAGLTPIGPQLLTALLMIGGLVLQLYAKLTLRRSFGVVPANRGLIVGGPYKLVRHPIYLAYFFGYVGFLLLNPTLWNLSIYVIATGLQLFRIQAEERLLANDPGFAAFRDKTRFRLLPGVW